VPTSTETASPWKLESSWAENGPVNVPKPKSRPKAAVSGVEVAAPAVKRRRFSPAEKLRIVRAANECVEHGSIEALMRKEGIYSSMLSKWRHAIDSHGVEGLKGRKPGRKAKRDIKDQRIEALEKRLAHTEQELSVTRALVDLQKKVSEALGVVLPKSGRS